VGVVEAAGDALAEVSVQHSQVVDVAAGTVQVVAPGLYWEAVAVVASETVLLLGLRQCLEDVKSAASTPAVAVHVAAAVTAESEQRLQAAPEVEVMSQHSVPAPAKGRKSAVRL
jgi:hypothetical protein